MKAFMKTTLMSLLVLGLNAGVVRAAQFEGEVDYNMSLKDGTQTNVNYFVKGTKARMEMTMKSHHTVMIIDGASKNMYMLMPEQKMYMTMNFSKPRTTATPVKHTFAKTGNTKVILGKTTEEWTDNSSNGRKVSMWAASGMGSFLMITKPQGGSDGNSALWDAAKKNGLFPLEMDTSSDQNSTSMVATKLDPKSLDDSMFTVPSDYKDMSDMMKGMGAGAPGGMPSGMPHF